MVAKPQIDPRGLKRICANCGNRFYDMNKRPIICPSCETEFTGEIKLKARRGRVAAADLPEEKVSKKPIADDDEEDDIIRDDEDDTLSLEDLDEGKDDDDDEDDIDLDLDDDIGDLDDLEPDADDLDDLDEDDIDLDEEEDV